MAFGEGDYSAYDYAEQQNVLYEQIGFGEPPGDPELHNLFYNYFYNDELSLAERVAMYDALIDHIEDEYGIDFADVWDWEDFRAWYEQAG